VNKSELVSRLATRLDGDRARAMAAVNGVLEEIEQSLARGEKVSLFGFGTFDRRERGPRTARNPATGETIHLGASVAPVFRAGAGLKQVLTDAAGTARTAAATAVSAVASVPAAAAGLTEPVIKAATKATSQGAKGGSKATKASKSGPKATKASAKPSVKAAGKGKPGKATAGVGKAPKKSSGKSAKKS
jgi:DNA-binding protein HU-beta